MCRRRGQLLEVMRRDHDGERRARPRARRASEREQQSPGRGGRARLPARRGAAGAAARRAPARSARACARRASSRRSAARPSRPSPNVPSSVSARSRSSIGEPLLEVADRAGRARPDHLAHRQERGEAVAVARVDEADRLAQPRDVGASHRLAEDLDRAAGSGSRPRRRASAGSSCRRRSARAGPSARRRDRPRDRRRAAPCAYRSRACQRQTRTSVEPDRGGA